jgi:hypothetical protein
MIELNLYSLSELERMVLAQTLIASGVENPAVFLEENDVEYQCTLKGAIGMAIAILKVTPKAKKVKPGAV